MARELLDVVGVPPPGLSPQRDGKQLTCSIRITENGDPGCMQLLRARDSGVCGGGRYRGLSLGLALILAGLAKGPAARKLRLRRTRRNDEAANHGGSGSMAGTTNE